MTTEGSGGSGGSGAPADPPPDPKTQFTQWFTEAMDAWAEKNKPSPQRTVPPGGGWFESLFGGGGPAQP